VSRPAPVAIMRLEWFPFGDQHPRPPTTFCLFSDGTGFCWGGWWSNSDQCIYIPSADASGNRVMHDEIRWRVKFWAEFENMRGMRINWEGAAQS
jgi:hypothetical protein